MFGADVAIMIMYVLGFACTGMVAFLVFIPANGDVSVSWMGAC